MQQIMTYAAALSKKGFDVRCFGTANEARRALLAAIPAGASVGIGGAEKHGNRRARDKADAQSKLLRQLDTEQAQHDIQRH